MNILGIDLGSTQACAVLAQKNGEEIKIIGFGKAKTQGVKKGVIVNMELAAKSIEQAVMNVEVMSGVKQYDKIVVSISGAYTKAVDSEGMCNVNNHEISIKEISRAVTDAEFRANIPNDYKTIQVLPYSFQINETDCVNDPLGMSAKRLVVSAHIIIAKESDIKNLKKVVELTGLRVDNLVLSGYASAIACLSESDEKALGAILIDIGGGICDMVVFMGNSIRYNDCIKIGSSNITQDLAKGLHTPLNEAEKIKLSYARLSQEPNALVQVPLMGDERKMNEYPIEAIANVMYARVNEILMLLAELLSSELLKKLNVSENTGAGVVLTGGMTKLARLDEVASAIFDNKSVRIATARDDLISGYDEINDPENSCAIGLCLYEAGHFAPYEIDSNKKLRYKGEPEVSSPATKSIFTPTGGEDDFDEEDKDDSGGETPEAFDEQKKKSGVFSKFWNKITSQF